MAGHQDSMVSAALAEGVPLASVPKAERLSFEEVYERWFAFVFRSVRRLGVPAASVDDATQEVFLVVYRRLPEFEGRSSIKTWLFSIALRVARDHRRSLARKRAGEPLEDSRIEATTPGPAEQAEKVEAARLVQRLLDDLDDEKREVFVLAELEQLTAPEMAEVLGIPLNTVYSRLRTARAEFERAAERHRKRERAR